MAGPRAAQMLLAAGPVNHSCIFAAPRPDLRAASRAQSRCVSGPATPNWPSTTAPRDASRSTRVIRHSYARENWHDGAESTERAAQAPTDSARDAHATVAKCAQLFQRRELDALLEVVPDEVIDAVLARRKVLRRTDAISFADVLQLGGQECLHLDTFALRNLIYNAPASITTLSTLSLGEGSFLERCLVRSQAGEECVLTFSLTLQDVLQSQYRCVCRVCSAVTALALACGAALGGQIAGALALSQCRVL